MPAAPLLSGCANSFEATTDSVESEQTPIGEIEGSVHGGQAPVTGAQVYLFAAGTGGYQTASTSLIPSSKNGVNGVSCTGGVNGYCYVSTDGNGNFTLGSASAGYDYTCTAGQSSTYPSAVGYSPNIAVDYYGDAFVTGGSNNGGVAALQPGSTAATSFSQSGTGTYVLALDATSNTNLTLGQYWTPENNVWTLGSGGTGTRWSMIVTSSTPSYTYGSINNQSYLGWMGGINTSTTPSSMAFDGAGSLWVANQTPAASTCCTVYPLSGITVSLTYSVSGMSSAGFSTGTATGTGAYLAVPDGTGNVWVANTDGSVSQMLGMATPVVTPLVPGSLATAP